MVYQDGGPLPQGWFGGKSFSADQKVWGADIASVAGVITLPARYQRVTGALAVTGIALPFADFGGTISVFPTGAFTWTTATNIALAGTAVVGKQLDFTYFPPTGKWYPSYIA